jgi:hypothetical protein
MKPEEQRIAIAKACGWKLVEDNPDYEPYWEDPKGNMIGISFGEYRLPNYLNDLNAMHEAENVLNDLNLYRKFLYLVVLEDPSNISNEPAWATATQRAEAFLRTLDLWNETSL